MHTGPLRRLETGAAPSSMPTVLIVPGLRDAVAQHWQTLLEAQLRTVGAPVASVPPMGRENLDCAPRWAAIERVAQALVGPIVIVAQRPLADYGRILELAGDWGSELVDLGPVGHLNPASGFGDWPRATAFIEQLSAPALAGHDAH